MFLVEVDSLFRRQSLIRKFRAKYGLVCVEPRVAPLPPLAEHSMMRPRMAYLVRASISFAVAPLGRSKRDILLSSVTFHIQRSVCLLGRPDKQTNPAVTGRLYSIRLLSDSGLLARSSPSEAIVLLICDHNCWSNQRYQANIVAVQNSSNF